MWYLHVVVAVLLEQRYELAGPVAGDLLQADHSAGLHLGGELDLDAGEPSVRVDVSGVAAVEGLGVAERVREDVVAREPELGAADGGGQRGDGGGRPRPGAAGWFGAGGFGGPEAAGGGARGDARGDGAEAASGDAERVAAEHPASE